MSSRTPPPDKLSFLKRFIDTTGQLSSALAIQPNLSIASLEHHRSCSWNSQIILTRIQNIISREISVLPPISAQVRKCFVSQIHRCARLEKMLIATSSLDI